MNNLQYEIVIAGGGPGGLMAALALERQGFSCLVVESTSREKICADIGGSYHIGSPTLSILEHLGVAEQCRSAGTRFSTLKVFANNGSVIMKMPLPQNIDMMTLRRSSLQTSLLSLLDQSQMRCGVSVSSFEETEEKVLVKLSTGDEIETNILIGADGVNSKVRQVLLNDGLPRFCDLTCCWGRVKLDQLKNPSNVTTNDAITQLGLGASIAIATIKDEVIWSAFWRTTNFQRSEDPIKRKSQVMEKFSSWASPTPEIIMATPTEIIAEVGIWDRDPCKNWYKGRVVLIGDAVHPMTPFLGQGANSAMIDAFVLAHYLGRQPYNDAFKSYQQRRKPITDRNIKTAREISDYTTTDKGWKHFLSTSFLRFMPKSIILHTMLKADQLNDISDILTTTK